MKCLVCECDPGGAHYQSICCRACAAFFKRTYLNNHQDSYKCHKEGICDVTNKMRFSCRSCRLKKCVTVGMAWNVDNDEHQKQSDGPSTSRSTHSQDEATHEASELESDEFIPDEFYTYEKIFGDYDQFYKLFNGKLTSILSREPKGEISLGLGICHQTREFYAKMSKRWLGGGVKESQSIEDAQFSRVLCNHYQAFELAANFCAECRQFCELPIDQRNIIFLHFVMRFPQMFRNFTSVQCLGYDLSDRRLVSKNGMIFDFTKSDMNLKDLTNYSTEELRSFLLNTQGAIDRIFAQPFKRLHADDFEIAYLIVSAMWTLEGVPGLTSETLKVSQEIRERISDELTFYYKHEKKLKNCAQRIYQLHNLGTGLDKIADLRTRDRKMYNMFNMFKINFKFAELVTINDD